jgi:antitoxin ParD1/3/4
MSLVLTPQHEALIKQKVESGLYGSPDEVIAKALALLEEYDRELAELREKVQAGIAQLENGQYTDYDEEGLRALKERIKTQGRERLRARQQPTVD